MGRPLRWADVPRRGWAEVVQKLRKLVLPDRRERSVLRLGFYPPFPLLFPLFTTMLCDFLS